MPVALYQIFYKKKKETMFQIKLDYKESMSFKTLDKTGKSS